MRLERVRVLSSALLAVIAATVTACSSSGAGDSETEPGGGTSASNLTKSPIVIGQIVGATGFNSESQAPSIDTAQAWAKWVNDNGGIQGHPIEVVSIDDKSTATTAATSASQLISKKVVAVVGSVDGLTEPAWAPSLAAAKIPIIGFFVSDPFDGKGNPYWFPTTILGADQQALAVDAAKKFGATKFAAVVCQESTGCQTAGQVFATEAAHISLSNAGFVQVSASAPNYNAACLTLKEKGADYLQLGLSAEVARRVVADCTTQGFKPKSYGLYAGPVNGPDIVPLSKNGTTFSGFIGSFPWWSKLPAAQQYRDVMTEYTSKHSWTENPNQTSTWSALELFRKAMAAPPENVTAQDVLTAMNQIHDEDLDGLLAQKVSYSASTPTVPPTCAFTFQLTGGEFQGGDTICLAKQDSDQWH